MALTNYIPRYSANEHATWEGEWELWSGIPVAMSPSPGMLHQVLSYRVCQKLTEALGNCENCLVVQDVDWRVDADTVLRPDLLVVCGHPLDSFVSQTPAMVVEILSDSTRQRDLMYKRDMYEKIGVQTYLIVDPVAMAVSLLKLRDGIFTLDPSPEIRLSEDCEILLELDSLFRGL